MRRLWPVPEQELDRRDLLAAYPRGGQPLVRLNMVSSLDGAATLGGRSGGLGSPADQELLGLLRAQADVVLVGAGTVRAEGYTGPLIGDALAALREAAGLAPHPRLAVVSARLDLDLDVLTTSPARPLLVTSADADVPAAFAEAADVVRAGDPAGMLAGLRAHGLGQVLCEGGPGLAGQFAAADALDEVCLTLSPVLAGPGASRIVAGEAVMEPRRLALAHTLTDGTHLFLRYRRP
ncbi:dihydrofolate reductase family protein [Catellatospora sp. KI3]|uniref:dihydrofolate reductase family protein n=1 Tax=Catellatospora sp. KI3 TaxID=3041620 RepID=UPI002482CC78|nr:dihydrofolate reductase family protein [Catellatospora sp. KI3]MDI1462262.1 dihydrofolate reductase family protein [Catellatospora sp. KI3]